MFMREPLGTAEPAQGCSTGSQVFGGQRAYSGKCWLVSGLGRPRFSDSQRTRVGGGSAAKHRATGVGSDRIHFRLGHGANPSGKGFHEGTAGHRRLHTGVQHRTVKFRPLAGSQQQILSSPRTTLPGLRSSQEWWQGEEGGGSLPKKPFDAVKRRIFLHMYAISYPLPPPTEG